MEQTPAHTSGSEPQRLTLRKGERLHSRSLVTSLFEASQSEYAYPLRMFYQRLTHSQMLSLHHGVIPPGSQRLQMMITVPKKRFRHAVDRVWLRRRIREAYRLSRLPLKQMLSQQRDSERTYLLLAFIYVGTDKRDYAAIQKKMTKLLDKASALIAQPTVQPQPAPTTEENKI